MNYLRLIEKAKGKARWIAFYCLLIGAYIALLCVLLFCGLFGAATVSGLGVILLSCIAWQEYRELDVILKYLEGVYNE